MWDEAKKAEGGGTWNLDFGDWGLPKYMVPDIFITQAALPFTSSGKIDRRQLEAMSEMLGGSPPREPWEPREPGDEVEQMVLEAFQEVLGSALGVEDDFFQQLWPQIQLAVTFRKAVEGKGLSCL